MRGTDVFLREHNLKRAAQFHLDSAKRFDDLIRELGDRLRITESWVANESLQVIGYAFEFACQRVIGPKQTLNVANVVQVLL